jgi:expansin (peptidoglycan-binding protein)
MQKKEDLSYFAIYRYGNIKIGRINLRKVKVAMKTNLPFIIDKESSIAPSSTLKMELWRGFTA